MIRAAAMRLLWAAARRLPDGEEILRERVAMIAGGSRSTRDLSDAQLAELALDLQRRAGLRPRPRGPRGGRPRRPEGAAGKVVYLATEAERARIQALFGRLGWPDERRANFISRQTRSMGLLTHAHCTAVIKPLERMLREETQ